MLDYSKVPVGTRLMDRRGQEYVMQGATPLAVVRDGIEGSPPISTLINLRKLRSQHVLMYTQWGHFSIPGGTEMRQFNLNPIYLVLPKEQLGKPRFDLSFLPAGTTFATRNGVECRILSLMAGNYFEVYWSKNASTYAFDCDLRFGRSTAPTIVRRRSIDAELSTIALPTIAAPPPTPEPAFAAMTLNLDEWI